MEAKQYIVTNLNKELYGIDIKYIDNIIVMQSITRVPKSQSYFKGVINLRGEIVPVMSLGQRLGIADPDSTPKTRIIIVRPEPQAAPVGLIVDGVKEVISLEAEAIEKINLDDKDNKANFSLGIGKYQSELINLINIPAVVIEKEANN
jgi:Chemotaxis signal transduction protein